MFLRVFFYRLRRTPKSTRTYTLFPYTTCRRFRVRPLVEDTAERACEMAVVPAIIGPVVGLVGFGHRLGLVDHREDEAAQILDMDDREAAARGEGDEAAPRHLEQFQSLPVARAVDGGQIGRAHV